MVTLTLLIAIALIITGAVAFIATAAASVTALIPAFLGVVLLVCALIARNDRARTPALVIALILAFLGAIGSLRNVMGLGELFAGTADNPGATIASTIMLVLLVVLLIAGIRWIFSRRSSPPRGLGTPGDPGLRPGAHPSTQRVRGNPDTPGTPGPRGF